MKIDSAMLEHLCELARLDLPQEERGEVLEQLGKILDYMEILNRLDTERVEPYDLAAIACWHLRQLEDAENYAETALSLAPEDERLQNNLRLIREAMSDGSRTD